ncbi:MULTISPECIES: carbon-nitrogen hydrolase family protein [Pseudomonadota]|jgi:predicted amidohydrolase|uniref:carbon-nitrogen hydrolase family protein n=1 Tax=Pseudomonadota TaxID=1224 RepID=UPI000769D674|nr:MULTISPECIES: carbon-nitrogen hydrolase family protein [Pseudomonadota]MAF62801.1 nitrilase [Blastomonas sp.]|tara:strand:+ start:52970 stop:53797 length:828 start_codon:yes stop_codon:yes gene_type:complete
MKIAVLQMTAGIDPADNARTLVQAVRDAKAGGADMLFTPEMSNLIDRNRARAGETIRGEDEDVVLVAVRAAAAEHRIWVHLGSLAVKGDAPDAKWRNRAFVIAPDGSIAARYDKIHLFDVDLASGESWRESAVYEGGEQAVAVRLPEAVLGLSICYDIRFSAVFAALSRAGADIIAVPAAFTVPTGQAHWHVLLRARAIENACFVVAAAQTGEHEDGRSTYGHSLVIDPWGEVLLDMGEESGLGFAELDLARIADVRARVPVIANRRPVAEALLP